MGDTAKEPTLKELFVKAMEADHDEQCCDGKIDIIVEDYNGFTDKLLNAKEKLLVDGRDDAGLHFYAIMEAPKDESNLSTAEVVLGLALAVDDESIYDKLYDDILKKCDVTESVKTVQHYTNFYVNLNEEAKTALREAMIEHISEDKELCDIVNEEFGTNLVANEENDKEER